MFGKWISLGQSVICRLPLNAPESKMKQSVHVEVFVFPKTLITNFIIISLQFVCGS